MKSYKITWIIEVDAPDAVIAASIARGIQLDPHNNATFFECETEDDGGELVTIDLANLPTTTQLYCANSPCIMCKV